MNPIQLITLVSKRDLPFAGENIASAYNSTGEPILVLEDGTLSENAISELERRPSVERVSRINDREELIRKRLQGCPTVQEWRDHRGIFQKLVDVHVEASRDYLFFDSDVRFTKRIALSRSADKMREYDAVFSYNPLFSSYAIGVEHFVHAGILNRVNSGVFFQKKELDFFDSLEKVWRGKEVRKNKQPSEAGRATAILAGKLSGVERWYRGRRPAWRDRTWVEQTSRAILFSKSKVGLFSEYQVTAPFPARINDAVALHYMGGWKDHMIDAPSAPGEVGEQTGRPVVLNIEQATRMTLSSYVAQVVFRSLYNRGLDRYLKPRV